MNYLTIEEVYFLHELAIKEAGGRSGIRDFSLIHSAISRSQATFGGVDLYPDIWHKAAALTHSLILNHPFEDGNKRTGFFSMNAFLRKNHITLTFTKQEGIEFCLKVENKSLPVEDIASFLEKHARKS